MKKLDYITILRAIAILMVLACHIGQHTAGIENAPAFDNLMDSGSRGVQLFYLLSALTLFLSFHRRSDKEVHVIRNYTIRRFFRIAPLYYVAIVYYLWQYGFGPRDWLVDIPGISASDIISNFTFTHGLNPYWINSVVPGGWSVGIEVLFYCMLPFLFLKIKNIGQAFNFLLITILLRFILLFFFSNFAPMIPNVKLWDYYLFYFLPNQLPIFATGIFLYFYLYDKDNSKISSTSLIIGALITIVGLSSEKVLLLPLFMIYTIAFFMLAVALNKYHPRILFNRVFIYIGNISYTLYLTHWAVIHFFEKSLTLLNPFKTGTRLSPYCNFVLNYVMILAVSVLFSTVLYYTIELPAQKLGKRLIGKRAD